MADVFLSYAHENTMVASALARRLARRGLHVWWDRELAAGEHFDQIIEKEIAAASCVLVLWSEASVKSRWVRNEATAGAERDVLIPIIIEDVTPPLAFRDIHAVSLVEWNGEEEFERLDAVVDAIRTRVGVSPTRADAARAWGSFTTHSSKDEISKKPSFLEAVHGRRFGLAVNFAFCLGFLAMAAKAANFPASVDASEDPRAHDGLSKQPVEPLVDQDNKASAPKALLAPSPSETGDRNPGKTETKPEFTPRIEKIKTNRDERPEITYLELRPTDGADFKRLDECENGEDQACIDLFRYHLEKPQRATSEDILTLAIEACRGDRGSWCYAAGRVASTMNEHARTRDMMRLGCTHGIRKCCSWIELK